MIFCYGESRSERLNNLFLRNDNVISPTVEIQQHPREHEHESASCDDDGAFHMKVSDGSRRQRRRNFRPLWYPNLQFPSPEKCSVRRPQMSLLFTWWRF